jgi:hypothetical protein
MPASIEVGGGNLDTGFVPVADGDRMPVFNGGNGALWLFVSVRLHDFESPADGLTTEVGVTVWDADLRIGGVSVSALPVDAGLDTVVFLGLPALFRSGAASSLIESGQPVRVRATVRDACGRVIRGEREILLGP